MPPVVPPLLRKMASDEYAPLPWRAVDRDALAHSNALISGAAPRLGLAAHEYAADRRGTAATLRSIDDAHGGGFFDVPEAATVDLATAGAQVLEYVKTHIPNPGQAPLCGNSIGVDRRFLDRGLPELDQYLHYRSIDVSSFKELCRRWYPAVYKNRPSKKETHRALDDIRESVSELRYYRETMLKPPEAGPGAHPAA